MPIFPTGLNSLKARVMCSFLELSFKSQFNLITCREYADVCKEPPKGQLAQSICILAIFHEN